MNDSVGVGERECVQQLSAHLQLLIQSRPSAVRDDAVERHSLEVFHHQVKQPAILPIIEYPYDIGVFQTAGQACLPH